MHPRANGCRRRAALAASFLVFLAVAAPALARAHNDAIGGDALWDTLAAGSDTDADAAAHPASFAVCSDDSDDGSSDPRQPRIDCPNPDAADADADVGSDSGVWDESYDPALGTTRCTIPRVAASSISRAEFEATYLEKRPVILVGVTDTQVFTAMTQKAALLRRLGSRPVTLSTANKNSYQKYTASLRHYISRMMAPQPLNVSGANSLYLFGDHKASTWAPLLEAYTKPTEYIYGPYASLSFGLGGSGTGVPFHTHGHVFAEVFHGKKRWWLKAPGPEPRFDPDESSLRWLRTVYPLLDLDAEGIDECVVVPGEQLYIPGFWHHATLNLGQTVFMSTFV